MNRKQIIRQWCGYTLLTAVVLLTVMVACVNLIEVSYDQDQVNAGEEAVFKMKVNLDPIADESPSRFVIAFCCPKEWAPRENVRVWFESTLEPGREIEMLMIPADEAPKNNPGSTWEAELWKVHGKGPNVLDDVQWVAFYSSEYYEMKNGQKVDVNVTIKTTTGMQNLRVKLGFFVNHTWQAMDTGDHSKVGWGDCFEVVNGEGDIIDFCELHANMNQPGYTTKNDIVTIKYLGRIVENDPLDGAGTIYMDAIAYTGNGNTYEKKHSYMPKEGSFGQTYAITFWPAGFFGIPAGEEITRIEYIFTNEDGSLQLLEDVKDDNGDVIDKVPFRFVFECK